MGRVSWKRPKSTHWRPFLDTSTSCAMSQALAKWRADCRGDEWKKECQLLGTTCSCLWCVLTLC